MGMSQRLLRPRASGYLLDAFTGVSAAYSLQRLRGGHSGSAVRVRRSSDNAEENYTSEQINSGTLSAWLGASTGYVVTWFDQSGNGNDVTQATAANQPQVNLTERSVFFPESAGSSANNSGYWLQTTSVPVTSNALTYFSVVSLSARNLARNKYGRVLSLYKNGANSFDYNTTSGALIVDTPDNGANGLCFYADSAIRAALPTLSLNTRTIVGGRISGSGLTLYRNTSTASGTSNNMSLNADRLRIGNNNPAFDSAMAGHYYVGVLFLSALPDDTVSRLTSFLTSRWRV